MKKLQTIFISCLVLYAMLASSENMNVCTQAGEKADRERALIPGYRSGRKVIGRGRAYFYTAPDKRCKMKDVFVIPNDRLDAYSTYGEFTEVVYWNSKNGDVDGWVLSSRLAETGEGIGPEPQQ